MRQPEFYFMALGGGQTVGASCYYLRLKNTNIIFDAGIGIKREIINEPVFMPLLTSPLLLSLNQIDQIFISHAHLDHSGYLLKLMAAATRAGVYMTEPTKLLIEHQLYNNDKKYFSYYGTNEEQRLAAQYLLEQITKVSYMQSIKFNEYTATFFQAGHIPGAMMIYIQCNDKNILYTGDYSLHSTALTTGYILPKDLKVDTLILCALHAKHPDYKRKNDTIYQQINYIYNRASSGEIIFCHINQLSKGVEFLELMNANNSKHIPIFIDDEIMKTVEIMEKLSQPILTPDNHSINEIYRYNSGVVIFSSAYSAYKKKTDIDLQIDFSLHEDFDEMKNFIRLLNPKQAFVVHCAQPRFEDKNITIEQHLMNDYSCRTQFTFVEEGFLYVL